VNILHFEMLTYIKYGQYNLFGNNQFNFLYLEFDMATETKTSFNCLPPSRFCCQ